MPLCSPRSLLWNSSTKGSDIGANLQSIPNESATFPYLPETDPDFILQSVILDKFHCVTKSEKKKWKLNSSPTLLTANISGIAEVEVAVLAADAAENVESVAVLLEVVVDPHDESFRVVPPHRLQVLLDAAVVKCAVRGGLFKLRLILSKQP